MFVLLTVCVLSVVAASLLLTNVARYQTAFQGASWQEAIVGAEAGVDLAMNELRQRVVSGPAAAFASTNWTTQSPQGGAAYANEGRAFPAGLVRPQTGFRNALMADQTIDLSNKDVLVDSYDSSKGPYSTTNQGSLGNLATNGQLINAMTNNGKVVDAQNVTGQERTPA